MYMCYVIYVDIVDQFLEAMDMSTQLVYMCCQLGGDIGRYCALEVLWGTNWGVISRYSALFGVPGALPEGCWVDLCHNTGDIQRYCALKVVSGTNLGDIGRYSALLGGFLAESLPRCSRY